jgi:hypothetical protein
MKKYVKDFEDFINEQKALLEYNRMGCIRI